MSAAKLAKAARKGLARMFFVTYLRRELSRRMRQAVVIALGLGLGVGLVVTVSAASAGVARAESTVLGALYGVGTDVTVTGEAPHPTAPPPGAQAAQLPPDGNPLEVCTNGTCVNMAGKTQSDLNAPYSGFSASKVAEAARLPGVAAAAGGITILDQLTTFPTSGYAPPAFGGYTVDGVDTENTWLSPLGAASLVSGHWFTAADANAGVAIVDSEYATSNRLTIGSAVTVGQSGYTIIGIVSQPQGSNPPSVYIPLARAQVMTLEAGSLRNEVNTIYLTAASAADIPAVSKEIRRLLPGTIVTTAGNLASQVTGSLTSAVSLVHNLSRWLTVLALAAAFAAASLLTLAAVSRRMPDFGILKALGWRSRRVIAQVLGESAAIGIAGAAAGVGLGFAGAAIIAAVAPKLYATAGADNLPKPIPQPGTRQILIGGSSLIHVVPVPLNPAVGGGVITLAVVLAVAGGLLAGAFGSWRIASLRPGAALARVG